MRTFPVNRPGSFLPIYSILLAIAQLWLTSVLHGAGRTWLVFSPGAPARFIPISIATLLGLGAIALLIAAWIVRRRGTRPMNRIAFQASAVACLLSLYALLTVAGYWFGFL